MPLASRATQARADRAGAPAEAPTTQPRQNPTSVPEPAQDAPAAPSPQGDPTPSPTEAPKRRGRPPGSGGAPRAARVSQSVPGDAKELRSRQRELEKEFKTLAQEQQQALRAHEQKFRERRLAIETEHRLIAGQLTSKIFNR